MSGMVGILNVGAGDVELSFDPRNPAERIRAARIVKDMIRRGYALLIEIERAGEKRYERALDFDEQACRYIVADMDPLQARETDMADAAAELRAQQKQQEQASGERESVETSAPGEGAGESAKKRGRKGRGSVNSIDAGSVRSVAVGRSSGG